MGVHRIRDERQKRRKLILEGMGSVLSIMDNAPVRLRVKHRRRGKGFTADRNALSGDWKKIGLDVEAVLDRLAKRTIDKK